MSAAAPRIAVVTTAGMQYPDPEAPIVADALRETGADARLWAWDAPADWGGFDLVLVRSPGTTSTGSTSFSNGSKASMR